MPYRTVPARVKRVNGNAIGRTQRFRGYPSQMAPREAQLEWQGEAQPVMAFFGCESEREKVDGRGVEGVDWRLSPEWGSQPLLWTSACRRETHGDYSNHTSRQLRERVAAIKGREESLLSGIEEKVMSFERDIRWMTVYSNCRGRV